MSFLLVAAEVEKLIAQAHQRFPLFLEQCLDLRHVLSDVAAEDVAASHSRQPRQKVVRRQGNIRRFVNQQMDRHRKPAFVFAVSYKIECLDELPVNHAHKVVEGFITVRDTAEQGDLLFAHFFQMEVVGVGQPCDLRQIKSGETHADTDQDAFECLASSHLKDMVLLHSNAFRVPHFKPCEQDIQGRLVFLIFLPDFRSRQHFHYHGEVLFLRRRFMHQVQHQRLQKRCFGFRPKGVRALCSGRSGGLDEGFNQAKNILVIPYISKGVIAKGGVGV